MMMMIATAHQAPHARTHTHPHTHTRHFPRSVLRSQRLSNCAIPTRFKQLRVLTIFVLIKKSVIYSTVLSGNEGRKAQGAMQGKRKLSTALFPKLWTVIYLLLGGCWNKVTYTDTLNSSFYAINY